MTRAVLLLTGMLVVASFGSVAQSNSPSGGQTASAQATTSTHPANAVNSSLPGAAAQGTTNAAPNKGIQPASTDKSAQGRSEDPRTASSAELPQTSTILPLLGLLGLGSLVAGLFARR